MTVRAKNRLMIPLLTRRGFVALSIIILGPFLGLLLPITWEECIAASGLILVVLFGVMVRDYQLAKAFFASLRVDISIPPRVYTGLSTVIEYQFSPLPSELFAHLLFRPSIPDGATAPHEIYFITPSVELVTLPYKFTPLSRGLLLWREVTIRVVTRSRLFAFQRSVELEPEAQCWAYPNPFCNPDAKNRSRQKLLLGETLFSVAGGEGREFDSLRQYAAGDDPRKIDWKRTARRGVPLVRLYRPETHQRINIAIDCSRRMSNSIDQRLQLDYAADCAAYLARLAQENDDEVGLFGFHHDVVTHLACRRGRRQFSHIMEELVKLPLGELEGDYELVKKFGRDMRRRSLIVLLTSITTPANLDNLRLNLLPISKKHLPLVVAVYDRELQRLIETPAESSRDAFMIGAAVQQREAIAERVNLLRRSGIECIYSDVLDIPQALEHKYYSLKLSGRL